MRGKVLRVSSHIQDQLGCVLPATVTVVKLDLTLLPHLGPAQRVSVGDDTCAAFGSLVAMRGSLKVILSSVCHATTSMSSL